LSVIARIEPVSSFGGAMSWICQFRPLADVTVVTARAGTAAARTAVPASSAVIERLTCGFPPKD
jgi:hypothetical protein